VSARREEANTASSTVPRGTVAGHGSPGNVVNLASGTGLKHARRRSTTAQTAEGGRNPTSGAVTVVKHGDRIERGREVELEGESRGLREFGREARAQKRSS